MIKFKYLSIFFISFLFSFSSSLIAQELCEECLENVPEDMRNYVYNMDFMDKDQPIGESVMRNWKSPNKPPWTIGYASTYAGNTWRKGAMERLMEVVLPKWRSLGMVDEIVITQSNLDDSLQIQQMRQMIDGGEVDAIIICCSNLTALNQTIQYGWDKGIPTLSFTGFTTSPVSINTSVNYRLVGFYIGAWMAELIGEKGNVVVMEGIPGYSASDQQNAGMLEALELFPDVNVVGQLAHNWTSQVAQKELSTWLATNPQKIDGIAVQSSGETGTLQALLQSGRDPIPPIALGGELGALCYWRQNPDYIDEAIYAWPPGDEIELGFEVLMRTMQGQGPKIQSILVGPATESFDDVASYLDEDCDRNSTGWQNPGLENWAPRSYVEAFFENPSAPEDYDISSH
jgi:ribose transport system substrate-binding protein